MITVVIITHNEEEVLEDAMVSIQGFSKEILIIDSNSTDNTVEIAKKHGAKVITHKMENFSKQRNFALQHVSTDWVFYLDADERLTPEFKMEALNVLSNFSPESNIAGYFVKRQTYYFGKDWGFSDQVQRLFFKKRLREWYGDVHESPKVEGEMGIIASPIIHNTHRNLSQMLEKTNKWSDIEAKLRYDANHPKMAWWRFPRVMFPAFSNSYFKEKGYKNGTKGIIEAMFQAYSMFVTYAKLWELQKKK